MSRQLRVALLTFSVLTSSDTELRAIEEEARRFHTEKLLSKQKAMDLCEKVDLLNDEIQEDEKRLRDLKQLDEQNRLLESEIGKIQSEIQKEKDQQKVKIRESNNPTFMDKTFDEYTDLYNKLL